MDESFSESSRPVYAPGDFAKYYYGFLFNAKKAAGVILDEGRHFKGLKETLLAALQTWSLNPYDYQMRREITVAAITNMLVRAESRAKKLASSSLSRDFEARYVILGEQFITELYGGVGGSKALFRKSAPKNLKNKLTLNRRSLQNIIEVMRIYHFVYENGASLNKSASLDGALRIFEKMSSRHSQHYTDRKGFSPLGGRELDRAWSDFGIAAPYLYAAAHTRVAGGKTLIDGLQAGELSTNADAPWVTVWLRHTAYAVTVLSATSDKCAFNDCSKQTPIVSPLLITETGLSEQEKAIIRDDLQ